jgi:ATP-binding cassette subfamily C protein CydCD
MAVLVAPPVAGGDLSAPSAALLVLLPLALAEVAGPLADSGALAARTRAAAARLDELTTRDPAVRDPRAPVPFHGDDPADLAVRRVGAAWSDRLVLDDVSLSVAAGRRIGVVGPSGSGKSTLAALLLRFVDPVHGVVEQAGVPLRRRALEEVRRRTGLVDDDPHLFATSLVENVRFARPGASDDEVGAALRRACLGAWLDALPDGLDTRLGEGGAAVSGGERARIGVARSLLADQPVLVLDEPTAHLDHATAELLAEEVLDATLGRTVVWITHEPLGLDRLDGVVDLTAVPRPATRPGSRMAE